MKEKKVEWYQDYKKIGHGDKYGKTVKERMGGGSGGGKTEKKSKSDSHTAMKDED